VRWAVLPGSSLTFATAWSGQPLTGRFDKWRADILFSPEALDRSKVAVTIDVASVDTGDQQRDAALPTDDWLDAAAHPQAVFTAQRFVKAGPERYVAHGRLTLRGVSRPVDLSFRLHITGDKAEARGVTSLDRTAFGVGQGEWQSTDQIPAKVTVSVDLKAKRG
jgi:polyisoprenoid-binding protein YceI